MDRSNTYSLPERRGSRPETNRNLPHSQVSQIAPSEMQEALFARAALLPGVQVGRSLVSLPQTRAFHLDPQVATGPREAFQAGTEFAHLHHAGDGSLHMMLPAEVAAEAAAKGWTEPHPIGPGVVLVYGPRDHEEVEVVWSLLEASHRWAATGDAAAA